MTDVVRTIQMSELAALFQSFTLTSEDVDSVLLAGGQVVEAEAKINANSVFSGRSTGGAGLAGSIQIVLVGPGEVDVGPSVIYGRIQELGGWIKPVHAKMLSWIDPKTGERVFAHAVHLDPHPYLRPAVDENINTIEDAMAFQFNKLKYSL